MVTFCNPKINKPAKTLDFAKDAEKVVVNLEWGHTWVLEDSNGDMVSVAIPGILSMRIKKGTFNRYFEKE